MLRGLAVRNFWRLRKKDREIRADAQFITRDQYANEDYPERLDIN